MTQAQDARVLADKKPSAIVVGVGAEQGLGAALCRRFAAQGYHVFVAGRTSGKIDEGCAHDRWADTRFAVSGEPRSYSRWSGRSVASIAAGEPVRRAATVERFAHAEARAWMVHGRAVGASAIG